MSISSWGGSALVGIAQHPDEVVADGGVGGFSNIPIDMVDPVTGGGFISLDTVGAISAKSFTATWDRSGNIFPISG